MGEFVDSRASQSILRYPEVFLALSAGSYWTAQAYQIGLTLPTSFLEL